ncbi:MAG: TonB-dependent receptor plug domain-containing protein, partial [Polaribacter sp.]
SITIVLDELETNVLDEVVVTGYQKIKKERATGSFEKINKKTLGRKINQSILSKIEGEAPGILTAPDGEFLIRGTSTFGDNTAPLIVVDGFPVKELSNINPNDIENITILKDAAAASIWGIKAANGVIVITSKKGIKDHKPVIEFSTNLSITPRYSLNKLPWASTKSFLEFEKHQADNGWARLPFGRNQEALSKGLKTYLQLNKGLITQAEADAVINRLATIDNRKEFDRLFRRDKYWKQYNLAISGGGKYSSYRTSVTYDKNENGQFSLGQESDQLLANARGSFNISPKLIWSNNIVFSSRKSVDNGIGIQSITNLPQYQRILDDQGNYIPQPRSYDQVYKEKMVALGAPYNWDYNLKQEFDNKDKESKTTLLRLQTSLTYDIFDFLTLTGSYQYEWSQASNTSLFNENIYGVRSLVNQYSNYDASTKKWTSAYPKGAIINNGARNQKSHTGRVQLNFNKSFHQGKHRVNSIVGYEVRQVLSNGISTRHYGYNPKTLTYANIPYGNTPTTIIGEKSIISNPDSFDEFENRYISYYANTSYTYLGKYTISGSTRLDDTNLFGSNKKYRNIPLYSLGLKWNLYKEKFMRTNNFINKLSLRATYGSNGNV